MPPKKRNTLARPSSSSSKPKPKSLPSKSLSIDPKIRAAFEKYATAPSDAEDFPSIEDKLITIPDIARALKALRLPLPLADFFEEDASGIGWVEFSDLAAAMGETISEDGGEAEEYKDEDEDEQREEIDGAFSLFFPPGKNVNGGLREGRITIGDLRRIARELKMEDVDEKVLRLMVEEANGDGSTESMRRGVGRVEFEGVMRRAGVF